MSYTPAVTHTPTTSYDHYNKFSKNNGQNDSNLSNAYFFNSILLVLAKQHIVNKKEGKVVWLSLLSPG